MLSIAFKSVKNPRASGGRHGDGLWLIQPWVMGLFLFSLPTGEQHSRGAQDEHDTNHVEDRVRGVDGVSFFQ